MCGKQSIPVFPDPVVWLAGLVRILWAHQPPASVYIYSLSPRPEAHFQPRPLQKECVGGQGMRLSKVLYIYIY